MSASIDAHGRCCGLFFKRAVRWSRQKSLVCRRGVTLERSWSWSSSSCELRQIHDEWTFFQLQPRARRQQPSIEDPSSGADRANPSFRYQSQCYPARRALFYGFPSAVPLRHHHAHCSFSSNNNHSNKPRDLSSTAQPSLARESLPIRPTPRRQTRNLTTSPSTVTITVSLRASPSRPL